MLPQATATVKKGKGVDNSPKICRLMSQRAFASTHRPALQAQQHARQGEVRVADVLKRWSTLSSSLARSSAMTLALQPMPPSEYVFTPGRSPKRLTTNALSEGVGLKVQHVVITASTDAGSMPCAITWGLHDVMASSPHGVRWWEGSCC